MKKLILFICVCILVTGCRTARYAKHYKANLDQFSRLIGPVKNPERFGDSIEGKINNTIEDNRQTLYNTTSTDIKGMAIGGAGAILGKVLPIGKSNQNLVFGISLAGIAVSILDLFISTPGPIYYNRKALEVISSWSHSPKDNLSLTSLRASLFSLQETWPAYAP